MALIAKPTNQLFEPGDVVIASSGSLSAGIHLAGRVPVGVVIPAAWTAAQITFQVSVDHGVTYVDLFDDAESEYNVLSPATSTYHPLLAELFRGVSHMKVRSGVSDTTVNQAAERTLVFSYGNPERMF